MEKNSHNISVLGVSILAEGEWVQIHIAYNELECL